MDKNTEAAQAPEWSHKVDVTELDEPESHDIEANSEERAALARRLNVDAVDSLRASAILKPEGPVVHVSGSFEAKIQQECVVTMDPVHTNISQDFEAWFSDKEQAISLAKARHEKLYGKGGGEVPILDEKDDPEPIIDGQIDLGELVAQFLSLSIDPYPHAEGVEYKIGDDSTEANPSPLRKNPFEALKEWKDKQEK